MLEKKNTTQNKDKLETAEGRFNIEKLKAEGSWCNTLIDKVEHSKFSSEKWAAYRKMANTQTKQYSPAD